MGIISEECQSVLTDYGGYRLKYELLETDPGEEGQRPYYGIRICQKREADMMIFDFCQIPGVTEELNEARALFKKAVEGLVMPVSLPDFIDDWQSFMQMI